jgi:hypothetical protein
MINDTTTPSRPSKRFESMMRAAQQEKEEQDFVINVSVTLFFEILFVLPQFSL